MCPPNCTISDLLYSLHGVFAVCTAAPLAPPVFLYSYCQSLLVIISGLIISSWCADENWIVSTNLFWFWFFCSGRSQFQQVCLRGASYGKIGQKDYTDLHAGRKSANHRNESYLILCDDVEDYREFWVMVWRRFFFWELELKRTIDRYLLMKDPSRSWYFRKPQNMENERTAQKIGKDNVTDKIGIEEQ